MSRRVLRVPLKLLEEGEIDLDEAASRYVARVHRLAAGDRFLAFDPERALEGDAEIVGGSRRTVRCRVGPLRAATKRPERPVTLLQALGKADKPERVIREATALGATSIAFVESARSLTRARTPADQRFVRWRRVAAEAARQCGRGDVPEISCAVSLASALEVLPKNALRLCLDPVGPERLGKVVATVSSEYPVVLLIGPEGGLSEEELGQADSEGFHRVVLGPFILRTETAATAALGAIVAGW